MVLRPIFDATYKGGETGRKMYVIYTSQIGPIPTKWELFLLCTRE